jgi:hypothetical protein
MNIPDTDLPLLPEPTVRDEWTEQILGTYTPEELREAQRQAYAKGIADFLKMHEGQAVAWMYTSKLAGNQVYMTRYQTDLSTYKADKVTPLFLAPQPQEVEAAVMADAERYRKLRVALADRSSNGRSHYLCSISEGHPEELDASVDAIRARTTTPEAKE